MITIETSKPVFSNAGGKTAEQKKASREQARTKAQGLYGKAKDSGLLASLENLALGAGKKADDGGLGGKQEYVPDTTLDQKKPMNAYLKWGLIFGGVALTGVAIFFAMRKKK